MGLVQFQIVPCSSLYFFSRCIGPFQRSQCQLQCFNLLHLSLPEQFLLGLFWLPLFASLFSVYIPPRHKGAEAVTYLGSLVQPCCGEGGALQTNIPGVCGARSQCLSHTGFAPLTACVLSRSTLLRPQVALQGNFLKQVLHCLHFPGLSPSGSDSWMLPKGTDSVGHAFCALPSSEQLKQPRESLECILPAGRCILSPSLSQTFGFLVHIGSTISGALCVSSVELISDCDPPGRCQPSRIPGRLH